ncbi:MAG: hypothetical protein CVT63_04195 [Candidatus Anoxymicrobium japonicum]|uniref:Peptidase M28 domain-containing protein n=1 Tax=Candidatus Anoxymicrobium japonicum TaxID=2013648 RepID=A0A2N3G6C7_9ACTN|nr:MAG: hypothetical protein CVT63_04195 [Candidatus Anoxymicrobium japonicum]
MDPPSKHVLYLSKRIGARGAGTSGEGAAASYILRAFHDSNLETSVETFSTWKSDMYGLLTIYMLSIAAYLLFRFNYAAGLAISILAFLVFQMETYTWAVISRLFPRSSASNVVAIARPSGTVRRKVVIVANYDSAKSSPLGRRALARSFRALHIISFACVTAIMLVGAGVIGASLTKVNANAISIFWLCASPFPAYLALMSILIAWGEFHGRYTAGANDNASGVGALISVMTHVASAPLDNTEIWGVATGRGWAGARGMISFLRRRGRHMRDAFIINLDHCGSGDTKIITREGAMLGFRCSWKLRRLALAAAARSKGVKCGKGKCRVKKSDAMAARVRGYKTITIGGGGVGGTYAGWRNTADVYDVVNRASLDRAVKLTTLLLEEIDSDAARKPRPRPRSDTDDERPPALG